MKKPKFSFPVKPLVIVLLGIIALALVIAIIWSVLLTSDFFRISDIVVRQGKADALSYLKGKNIFTVDLSRQARIIQEAYPDYSKVRIVRVLPDRIFVDFVKRRPAAFVKLYKYFVLDEDSVLFDTQAEPQEPSLPVIVGLETKIFGPKPGTRYNIKELKLALLILKEAKANRAFKDFSIKKIDVTNLANTSIFIPIGQPKLAVAKGRAAVFSEGIEVKLGIDNIKEKMFILSGILIQAKKDLSNIKYIDLRFKEPVIKLNNVKQ